MKEAQNNDLLLTKDVCQRLRINSVTLWRLTVAGIFPKPDLRLGKLKKAWFSSTIENWIAEQHEKTKITQTA